MKQALKYILRIGFPLVLAAVILHWMYRGVDWGAVWAALEGGMNWWWMLLSMPFGSPLFCGYSRISRHRHKEV